MTICIPVVCAHGDMHSRMCARCDPSALCAARVREVVNRQLRRHGDMHIVDGQLRRHGDMHIADGQLPHAAVHDALVAAFGAAGVTAPVRARGAHWARAACARARCVVLLGECVSQCAQVRALARRVTDEALTRHRIALAAGRGPDVAAPLFVWANAYPNVMAAGGGVASPAPSRAEVRAAGGMGECISECIAGRKRRRVLESPAPASAVEPAQSGASLSSSPPTGDGATERPARGRDRSRDARPAGREGATERPARYFDDAAVVSGDERMSDGASEERVRRRGVHSRACGGRSFGRFANSCLERSL